MGMVCWHPQLLAALALLLLPSAWQQCSMPDMCLQEAMAQ